MNFKLLILLLTLSLFKLKAQLVSIDNTTISIAPSYTLNHSDAFTVTGSVKNAGTTTLTGNVHVHFAIDTSTTIGVTKFLTRVSNTYPQTNFLPNTTFPFSLGDNANQGNNYKIAGNGITVVVWASYGPNPLDVSATNDSVLSHIYVLPPVQSIDDEKYFEENSIIVENPAHSVLSFEFLVFNKEQILLDLINSNGECVISQLVTTKNSTLNTNNLSSGMYYLQFTNKHNNKTLTKKIIILN